MKKLILCTLFFSLFIGHTNAQDKATQKEIMTPTYQKLKKIIQSQQYRYIGTVVYNRQQRKQLENDTNFLTITDQVAYGNLDALGTYTYSISKSNSKISKYKALFDDNEQQIRITFNVEDAIFEIEVKPNGNVFLTLQSGVNNITQTGKIERI